MQADDVLSYAGGDIAAYLKKGGWLQEDIDLLPTDLAVVLHRCLDLYARSTAVRPMRMKAKDSGSVAGRPSTSHEATMELSDLDINEAPSASEAGRLLRPSSTILGLRSYNRHVMRVAAVQRENKRGCLRFAGDARYQEAQRLLRSDVPATVRGNDENEDTEQGQTLQDKLFILASRTMALPFGK